MSVTDRRWYGNVSREPTGKAQVDRELRRSGRHVRPEPRSVQLSEDVLRLAFQEYERQHGTRQSYESMQGRGGLSVLEVVGLLADRVENLEHRPLRRDYPADDR